MKDKIIANAILKVSTYVKHTFASIFKTKKYIQLPHMANCVNCNYKNVLFVFAQISKKVLYASDVGKCNFVSISMNLQYLKWFKIFF